MVSLRARCPERPERLDTDLQLIKSFTIGRKVQAVRLMLPQPPAGAEPAEGAAVAERIKRRDGLGDDSWFAKRDGGHQSAQPKLGVKAGEHAEGDPRLGNRLPGTVHLRNLDQMVHQCDAVEADRISCQSQVTQPAGGIGFCPRKPRHLEDYSRSRARIMIMIESRLHDDWCVGRAVLLDDQRLIPVLISSSVEQSFDLSQLIGEDRRRYWSIALSIALAA